MSTAAAAPRIDAKVCVITGATSGIGSVVARELGQMGAEVAIVGRDPSRLDASLRDLHAAGISAHGFGADLGDLAAVRSLARDLRAAHPRIDVLVNNAGGIFPREQRTPSGQERTLAVNVLAPFLLTERLLPTLEASGHGRVVNVASSAHRLGRLHRRDLELSGNYTPWKAYNQSKLALVLLTEEAARRHARGSVTFNSCHPGFVRSRFGSDATGVGGSLLHFAQIVGGISEVSGARTPVYLARSPDVATVSGEYFVRCRPRRTSRAAQDREAAAWLWAECERRTAS